MNDIKKPRSMWEKAYIKLMYELIGINNATIPFAGGRMIPVTYIEDRTPLGTEDGQSYTVYPSLPDDDEEGLHGRNAK